MGALFDGLLIRPNATVTVQQGRASQDASGGTVMDYGTVIADDVPALISQTSGNRDGRFEGDVDVLKGSLLGDDPSLGRQDTRLVVKTGQFAGLTLRVDSVTAHPGSAFGLVPPRYSVQWSEWGPST